MAVLQKRIIESTADLSDEEINQIIDGGYRHDMDKQMLLALLFLSPSTRTRLSCARSAIDLGMNYVLLGAEDLRLSDTENEEDTGLALSQYADLIGVRYVGKPGEVFGAANTRFRNIASGSKVPIINLECDMYHPCQGLADLKTIREQFPDFENRRIIISWAYSPSAMRVQAIPNELLLLLSRFMKNITLVHPPEFSLDEAIISLSRYQSQRIDGTIEVLHDLEMAPEDADIIYPRNWATRFVATHGAEQEKALHDKYAAWKFDEHRMDMMGASAHYMHCLPVHRGYEASNTVIDGKRSLIKHQMRNRVDVQKALIHVLIGRA
ncbi:MAG: hypothetical protein EB059_06745 [Alphaproteobacteria bacterium]|nr:hypothetical protein [Alphaproteobacteria bacterium]